MNANYPNLEKELEKLGLKRKDLAVILKVRSATVYDKLNGKYPFTLNEAVKIKDELFPSLTVDYLFTSNLVVA